jgi:predicted nucleic acid-binding Zn ribbon protein
MAKILSRWEEIAGVALAGHVRPVGMTGSTLVVAADHPARATQVRMLSGELLSRIREMAGDAPDEIRVVVRPATSGRQPPEENGPVG